ncbi:MAG TPA: hypothetical protein PLP47_06575 [Methanofastidiosum sp.]|nr:hypothetical protein [Methanofastidiosum sp.]HOG74565.1 hypothetical protein [Methanofastidiosum sp.]HQQ49448.1 hypothetical protein [Methanofastidiosum sp.]
MASETIEIKKELLYEIVEDIEKLQAELETILNPEWEKAINEAINDVDEGRILDRVELEKLWKEKHV